MKADAEVTELQELTQSSIYAITEYQKQNNNAFGAGTVGAIDDLAIVSSDLLLYSRL